MRYIGWAVVLLFIAGAIGLIDFHVCIRGPGQCTVIRAAGGGE